MVKMSKAETLLNNTYFKSFSLWCKKYAFCSLPSTDYYVSLYRTSLNVTKPSASTIIAIVYGISWAH